MTVASFIVGTVFGAVVLSTIPTTGKLISEISPYFRTGAEFLYPYAVMGLELILDQIK